MINDDVYEQENAGVSLVTDACLNAEVQQWLVDRASGEGGLWGGLHPQPRQTGEHPSAAGTEDETKPTQLQVTMKTPLHLQYQPHKWQPHFLKHESHFIRQFKLPKIDKSTAVSHCIPLLNYSVYIGFCSLSFSFQEIQECICLFWLFKTV